MSTLAGSSGNIGARDRVGALATFNGPVGVAISPDSSFALVAVRAWPRCIPASRLSRRWRTHLAYAPGLHAPPPSEAVPAAAPRRRLAPRSACPRPMHRRRVLTTKSARSSSPPGRPPRSPVHPVVRMQRAFQTGKTASKPLPDSPRLLALRSSLSQPALVPAAPSRSLPIPSITASAVFISPPNTGGRHRHLHAAVVFGVVPPSGA